MKIDMKKLENSNIFNEGDKLKKGLINVNKTYEHVRSISKQKNASHPIFKLNPFTHI